jgi:hypothetical protein
MLYLAFVLLAAANPRHAPPRASWDRHARVHAGLHPRGTGRERSLQQKSETYHEKEEEEWAKKKKLINAFRKKELDATNADVAKFVSRGEKLEHQAKEQLLSDRRIMHKEAEAMRFDNDVAEDVKLRAEQQLMLGTDATKLLHEQAEVRELKHRERLQGGPHHIHYRPAHAKKVHHHPAHAKKVHRHQAHPGKNVKHHPHHHRASSFLEEGETPKQEMAAAQGNVHRVESLLDAIGARARMNTKREDAESLLQVGSAEQKQPTPDGAEAFKDMTAMQDGVAAEQQALRNHLHRFTNELNTGVFPSSLVEEDPEAAQHRNGWKPMKEVEAHFEQTLKKLEALPAREKRGDEDFVAKMKEKHDAFEARRKKNEEEADPLGIGEQLREEAGEIQHVANPSSFLEAPGRLAWKPMKEVEEHFTETLKKLDALPGKHKKEDEAFIEKLHAKHAAWEARRKKNEAEMDPLGIDARVREEEGGAPEGGDRIGASQTPQARLLDDAQASSLLERGRNPLHEEHEEAERLRRKLLADRKKLHEDAEREKSKEERLLRQLKAIDQGSGPQASPSSLLEEVPMAMQSAVAQTQQELRDMRRGLQKSIAGFNEERAKVLDEAYHPERQQVSLLEELPEGDANDRLRAAQRNAMDVRMKMVQDREAEDKQAADFKKKATADLLAFEKHFGHHPKPGEPTDPLGEGAADLDTDDKDLDAAMASSLLQGAKAPGDFEKSIDRIVNQPAAGPPRRSPTAAKVASLLGEYATELSSDAKALAAPPKHASFLEEQPDGVDLSQKKANLDLAVDKLKSLQTRIGSHVKMFAQKEEQDEARFMNDLDKARSKGHNWVHEYDRELAAIHRGRDLSERPLGESLIQRRSDPTYDQLTEQIQEKEMGKALDQSGFESNDDFMQKETQLLDHAADPLKKFQAQLDSRVSQIERGEPVASDPSSLSEVQLRTDGA